MVGRRSVVSAGFCAGVLLALPLLASPAAVQGPRVTGSSAPSAPESSLSAEARELLAWVRQTADHQHRAFAIIDKQRARLWLFDAGAVFVSSTPVLLGAARGDHSVPGIGERPMAEIRPHERTTPAGRFVAEPGQNAKGDDIFWVDYDAAVSMHRVRAHVASERRLQRLLSATPEDNRISYGCINVPVNFYNAQLKPAFLARSGWVYVLPEMTPVRDWLPRASQK